MHGACWPVAIVAVLSDFRAEGWEDPLARLAAAHDVVAITTDDPWELDLPDAGWVDLQDAETGARVLLDSSHEPTRTRFRAAAEHLRRERTRRLVQTGVDRVALQGWAAVEAVRPIHLQDRPKRRRYGHPPLGVEPVRIGGNELVHRPRRALFPTVLGRSRRFP